MKNEDSPNSPAAKLRPIGPVKDMEAHVSKDWWRQIFNGLYLKTDGDVVMDEDLTRSEVDLWVQLAELEPGDRLLDLCCGQGRHTLELARRGFVNVEGLDRSRSLIQRARRIARSAGLPIRFREGDARRLPQAPDSLDVVLILGNSFGYFETVEEDLRILREVSRVLVPGGRILIDVADGDYIRETFQARAWEWIDGKSFVCRERSLSKDRSRLISREIITHSERGVLADQFYAERLYTRQELVDLLQRAGFVDPVVHSEIETTSQRNQDLGMMARRLILTAHCQKPRKEESDVAFRHFQVTVLMGDPTIPDGVKPDAVFDDDDFATISELQTALSKVPGFDITYSTHHETLVSDLLSQRDKIDFVLNLCDEGFANNPRWELHVPALLDMLGIPYSGAGPQCLAYCFDKSLVRGIAQEMGIAVPEGVLLTVEATSVELPFPFPAIVKPNFGDSSVGITQNSVVWEPEDLLATLAALRGRFGHDLPVLIETFLTGQDLTVGIIGNPPDDYRILPVIEEDYSRLPEGYPKICGYEAKWLPNSPYWDSLRSIPAELPKQTLENLQKDSLMLFQRLECRDYARFDWRLDSAGEPRLLEANPNPGWCWDGHLAKMAALDGLNYSDMLAEILQSAAKRMFRHGACRFPNLKSNGR
jgi:D-alanine-D-alanine ligase